MTRNCKTFVSKGKKSFLVKFQNPHSLFYCQHETMNLQNRVKDEAFLGELF